ncbi:APX7, partial [Symbiodinium sp. KB8]
MVLPLSPLLAVVVGNAFLRFAYVDDYKSVPAVLKGRIELDLGGYGLGYRGMCRFRSGPIFMQPVMKGFDYDHSFCADAMGNACSDGCFGMLGSKKVSQLKACKQDLKKFIDSKNCHPIMVRLAWHDSGTYDQRIKDFPERGGANGAIRFEGEMNFGANAGLDKAKGFLDEFAKKYPEISWADLIQMASAVAIECAGGPAIDMKYGRVAVCCNNECVKSDSREGFGGNAGLPDAKPPFGCGAPTAAQHLRNVFTKKMGFTDQEIVALSGAHTIGRAFKERSGACPFGYGEQSASKYTKSDCIARKDGSKGVGMVGGAAWTKNWLTFDNSYFKDYKLSDQNLLWFPTDEALHTDPEFKKYFELYAKDQDAFFKDYAKAHKKLSELGAKFAWTLDTDGYFPTDILSDPLERMWREDRVNIKSCFTTLDELFQFANKHKHHFVSLVEPVAKETGAAFFDPDLKGQVRCQSKTKFESMYLNLALDSQRAWTDIVRDTLSYANLTDMYKRIEAVIKLHWMVDIVTCSSQFGSPAGAFEIKRQHVSDVSADDKLGCRNTLEWAKKDVESVLRVLNENFEPLLHKAAAQGNSDMLQLFIENRANVNLQEKTTERTALHEAMDQGLCIMGPDLSGSSTRLIVFKRADGPFAQTLAAACASRKRKRGTVRLHVVADNMETHPAGWMNPNSKTEHDKIALHMALAQGHTSVVDIWLKQEVYGYSHVSRDQASAVQHFWEFCRLYFESKGIDPKSTKMMRRLTDALVLRDTYWHEWNRVLFMNDIEITKLSWFQSRQYQDFFEFLDSVGGFWLYRWGDHAVRTIAVALFLNPDHLMRMRVPYGHQNTCRCGDDRPKEVCVRASSSDWWRCIHESEIAAVPP